jgi:hypothetical protein
MLYGITNNKRLEFWNENTKENPMRTKLKNFIVKHHIAILSFGIFSLVFCLLGLPFTHWWFNGSDDFNGLYLGFRTKTWHDLFYFFLNGNISQDMGPSNYIGGGQTTFLSTYYRPLYCVYLTLQYWIFGTNAYWYFLCNVFFHAINTVLLFTIFSWITSITPALFAALLFAFHPQIAYRFGAIVNFHYYINVMFMLLTFITFKQYLDTKKIIFYLFACTLFALSLFTRESSIVLPAILSWGTYLYMSQQLQTLSSSFFKKIFLCFIQTIGIWLVAFGFLALRLYLYPLDIQAVGNTHPNFLAIIHGKISQFLVLMYDAFWLSWLPWGHPITRAVILASCLLLFTFLFIKNSHKKIIVYFLAGAALMLWPGYIGCYSPRYMYEALPFVLLAFIGSFEWYNGNLIRFKKFGLLLLTSITLFFMSFTVYNFARREHKLQAIATAMQELVANPLITNRPLCFLSYPMDGLGDQPSDVIRVLYHSASQEVYCDASAALVQADSNIVTPCGWCNKASEYYTKNYVCITPVPGGFRYASLNSQKVQFFIPDTNFSLGKKVINKKEAGGVTDFTLFIDPVYLKKDMVYLVWDYENKRFVLLGSSSQTHS